jgi:hypothetical protein
MRLSVKFINVQANLNDLNDWSLLVTTVVESWLDVESVALRRLPAERFSVVDRPRPRQFLVCS